MTNGRDDRLELSEAAVAYLWRGQTIEAIKLLRNERKIGLKEAKELVDSYVCSQPSLQRKMEAVQAEMKRKLARGLIWFIILAVGAAYLLFKGW